jgi:NADPH-dependent 2,4-dienoyl-CoA reductase/sulfur reductase-like enzyme
MLVGPAPARAQRSVPTLRARPKGPRLVVVGASFAGLTLARTVTRLARDVEILLLERAPFFAFPPAQFRYLFGLAPLQAVKRDYAPLRREGLAVLGQDVVAVDRDRRRVVTATGAIEYDYLALASGIRLAPEEVPGLAERPDVNLCPYEGAPTVVDLRRRIAAFRAGHVVIATPNGPYKCQPAPYEYALAWVAHITRRRLKARVTLVDPRSRPAPPALSVGLMEAMEAHARVLTYEPFSQVRAVDTGTSTLDTEAGRLSFDILSVIPPNTTMPFVTEAGLGEPFVEVDPRTWRSTRDPRIYAVGDTADTPYAKTGYTAMDAGRIAGEWIAQDLGVKRPGPGLPANVCYPMVDADRAFRIDTRWTWEEGHGDPAGVKIHGTTDNKAKASHARLRRAWEARTLATLFPP